MAARGRHAAALLVAIVTAVGAGSVSSCTSATVDQIDYAVDGGLITYNTTTVAGAASAAPQAFSRTLTGFGYHGPDGQILTDHDFGGISVVGRAPLVLDYQIADAAVYSDGKPITCDDLVLAWAAQSGRFPGFDAASRGGYLDIDHIECRPGQKKARVSFFPDRSIVDYEELFTATSMMPSHVIGDKLGVNTTEVLLGAVGPADDVIAKIAETWNTIWQLDRSADLRYFPSSGPYKIDSVLEGGAVVLVANDQWWGAKPVTKRITVWPQSADIADRVSKRVVEVVDVATGSAGSLITPDDYLSSNTPSGGIEQLIFAPAGPLSEIPARRAVALCTPRDVIAADAGAPLVNSRLNTAMDDAFDQAENVPEAAQFAHADPNAARDALAGKPLTVRIGYRGPNTRLAAVVGAITTSCAPAGITINEVASESIGPLALREGQIDVLLASTGGSTGSGSTGSSVMDAYELFSGNGNNLSGYRNDQIDGIISALAVTADPTELVRLLAESAPVLWADMPTLPLYRQQRTLLSSKKTYGVAANPTRWGAGWNMDRWALQQ
ncbi:ABC transporter substrate-binding protein [[Mycobacterium] nativiensis]|uniref:ABC transporter substrate-binding protein n=1 Tax=[Mycobacterium] nativiensis TaxID=2855503 RepID=A0ABU5XSQ4_9MYCO|nr:ABC transporter substrate-binding protein [Mycolicibacter sp. MYC340]MEB3031004.1 ABC transporter substrate-binding protein [Mycolicibacter sp. MYC340]